MAAAIRLDADARARAWLEAHPESRPRVVAYEVHRCCGGGKICMVDVRRQRAGDSPADYVTGAFDDGTQLLIDRRAASRLPARVGLTVRGLGPFEHLDLDLTGDQWGELLYEM